MCFYVSNNWFEYFINKWPFGCFKFLCSCVSFFLILYHLNRMLVKWVSVVFMSFFEDLELLHFVKCTNLTNVGIKSVFCCSSMIDGYWLVLTKPKYTLMVQNPPFMMKAPCVMPLFLLTCSSRFCKFFAKFLIYCGAITFSYCECLWNAK